MHRCVLDYHHFGANMSCFLNKPHERQQEDVTDDATFIRAAANNNTIQFCHVNQHLKYNYGHIVETRNL